MAMLANQLESRLGFSEFQQILRNKLVTYVCMFCNEAHVCVSMFGSEGN